MDNNRFTQKSLEALQNAQQIANSYGNPQIEQIHLCQALLEQEAGLIPQLLSKMNIDPNAVHDAVSAAIMRLPKIAGSNQQSSLSPALSKAINAAEQSMRQMRDEYLSV